MPRCLYGTIISCGIVTSTNELILKSDLLWKTVYEKEKCV